jgi:phosphatidylinositol alpha-1,6-mannosyltransferase
LRINILIIPTNDWVRAPGRGHINQIAEKLAERGHNVYAWHFDYYRNEQIRRKPRKIQLLRSKTIWVRDPSAFFSLNALFQAPMLFRIIRKKNIEVVINENILFGLMSFAVAGDKVLKVFDFSDYFPESASVFYKNSESVARKIVESVVLFITKLNIRLSDVCLAVCRSLMCVVRQTDSKKPCYMITNGVDNVAIAGKTIEQACPTNNMIIMGIIDEWLDLITPLESLVFLRSKLPDIRLAIVGPWRKTDHRNRIKEFIDKHQLNSNVDITGYVSERQLFWQLSRAKCCIIPYTKDNFSSLIRLPEKLFVYSAFGKPILSVPLPEIMALNCKHVQYYHNAYEFYEKALKMLKDCPDHTQTFMLAKRFAEEHDVSVLSRNLERILEFTISRRRQ